MKSKESMVDREAIDNKDYLDYLKSNPLHYIIFNSINDGMMIADSEARKEQPNPDKPEPR